MTVTSDHLGLCCGHLTACHSTPRLVVRVASEIVNMICGCFLAAGLFVSIGLK